MNIKGFTNYRGYFWPWQSENVNKLFPLKRSYKIEQNWQNHHFNTLEIDKNYISVSQVLMPENTNFKNNGIQGCHCSALFPSSPAWSVERFCQGKAAWGLATWLLSLKGLSWFGAVGGDLGQWHCQWNYNCNYNPWQQAGRKGQWLYRHKVMVGASLFLAEM